MGVALSELFYYDESSPTCLRWKVDRFSGRYGNIKSASAGDVAGSLDARKEAYTTRYNGKAIKVHRIIVVLHGILLDACEVVDHEDGDATNNVFTNLRVVVQVINSHNRRKQHNNTSGVVGVSEWADQRGSIFWLARWQDMAGVRHGRSFSIRKYGATSAFQMATQHRKAMISKLTEAGHGYTERHGK